jgi:hypothetical protein
MHFITFYLYKHFTMAIAIYNIMIELVRAQVALESGSFEVPSPSAAGRKCW